MYIEFDIFNISLGDLDKKRTQLIGQSEGQIPNKGCVFLDQSRLVF